MAFFAGRDRYAGMIYKCCESLNLRIPEDVSVVGYDNISWENGEKNGLTTIAQPVAQIGQEAFNAICSAVELKGQGGQKMLGGELILRRSVAPAGKE